MINIYIFLNLSFFEVVKIIQINQTDVMTLINNKIYFDYIFSNLF